MSAFDFTAGQTLTADALNTAFANVAPPAESALIGSTGTAFTMVSLGTGLSLTTGTLAVTITAAMFAALDLSGLPTSNPGGGKPWLNGGVLMVGAI